MNPLNFSTFPSIQGPVLKGMCEKLSLFNTDKGKYVEKGKSPLVALSPSKMFYFTQRNHSSNNLNLQFASGSLGSSRSILKNMLH